METGPQLSISSRCCQFKRRMAVRIG
jgi:hypothetical protein